MVTKLSNPERLIINQLIDNGLFISNPNHPTQEMVNAINVLKRPRGQQRINSYINNLIGVYPENVQENLLLMIGSDYESSETVHVLLATLKAVINLPELQASQTDRSVLAQTIIRQVHSEVVDLDEKEIRRIITELFVDRFKLFKLDYPELIQSEQNQEVTEYWNISPDFNLVAQAMVNQMTSLNAVILNDEQRVNRALLLQRFISSKKSPQLWKSLLDKKEKIAEQWANLDRFDIEIGDNYALLLDKKRQQAKSKPAVVAIAVARAIHTGISEVDLNVVIKEKIAEIFPNNNIGLSLVKESLIDFGLINIHDDFIFPTPIIQRFAVSKKNRSTYDE